MRLPSNVRLRFQQQVRSARVYRLAAQNWREYGAHAGSTERSASCEANRDVHRGQALRLLVLLREERKR